MGSECDNTIAVRVDHGADADSRWYTGSGIYRDVWLLTSAPVHIAQWGVYAWPEVKENSGTLHVQVELVNDTRAPAQVMVLNELLSPAGEVVATHIAPLTIAASNNARMQLALDVDNPLLWHIEHPDLYYMRTSIHQQGEWMDGALTRTGFRTFAFDPDHGFALNGEWMKVKGVCLHHDAGVVGAEVSFGRPLSRTS